MNTMVSRVILRLDLGFHIGILLRPLLKSLYRILVFANGSVTDRWKTHILLKKLMLACKFNIAATLVTSVV